MDRIPHVLLSLLLGLPALAASEWQLGPVDAIQPDHLADPRRPRTEVAQVAIIESELGDVFGVGDGRFALAVGERFRALRYAGEGGTWQLDIDAAIFAQFDQAASLDNIGWDGVYGAQLSNRRSEDWAWKVAYLHRSAHLGDEFVLETGRDRIDYTRDEFNLGVAWTPPAAPWAFYFEAGYGVTLSSSRQQPLKLRAGLQRVQSRPVVFGHLGWYLAADGQWFEEESWDPVFNLRAALTAPTRNPGRGFELGLELYHGRSPLGEFTPWDEAAASLFLAYDL